MSYQRPFEKKLQARLLEDKPLLQILLGPRQVGKTTAARHIFEAWTGPKIMVSADSPTPPTPEWIRFYWQQAQNLSPDALLIIDEVQKIQGWSEQVKILFDQTRHEQHLRVLLLGSSSLNLQKGLVESLAGRFELTHASHWTFAECRQMFGWDLTRYLKYGGYPGVAPFVNDEERWRSYTLGSIIEPVLGQDILSQRRIDKPALLRQCFELCMQYPAQEISYNKLLGQLQDKGNATTIRDYLNLFEQCFLITPLQKYTGAALAGKISSPKIIVMNSALIHAYQSWAKLDADPSWYGRILECAVGAHLSLIPNSRLYYWREGQTEVDFVLKTPQNLWAFEIKSGLKKAATHGLEAFAKKYKKARCEVWDLDKCQKFMNGEINLV
ncbi:AAA family ATPase [bacterium]|nr:AAA family ATPase [bacterium]